MKKFIPSKEQQRIFDFNRKQMVISASAGSGKTTTMIEFISQLIEKEQPVKRLLVMTFTKAAASEMKERLSLSLIGRSENEFIRSQIDDLLTSDICTIHSFLEKVIRRNLSQFPYLEGFRILDEMQSSLYKEEAFEEAKRIFKEQNKEAFLQLMLNIQNENVVKEIVFSLDDFLCAQANKAEAFERLKDYKSGFAKAEKYLSDKINGRLSHLLEQIDLFPRDNAKAEEYLGEIRKLFTFANNLSLRELALGISQVSLPTQPRLTGYDKKEDIVEIKLLAKELISFAAKLSPQEDVVWENTQNEKLCAAVLELYRLFDLAYNKLKEQSNALDFNDLELKSLALLKDEQILSELQENYDYVFIDEYQDTSPVQEKIVKLISEKGRFVAIGDPKQGIYAFRNATSEIILRDIEDFEHKEEAQAEKLSKNYRSDKEILKFVNLVFSKIMTKKTSGIDYLHTSYLEGDNEAPKAEQPAVQILVAQKTKRSLAPVCEDYDIYADKLVAEEGASLEAQMIAAKIDELLVSEFVDPKTGEKRRVEPSDIAILSRSKGGICDSVMNELRKKDIPFVSTLRTDLTSKAHTLLVISLLSLCVDECDDISLASYLSSPLCLIDLQTLALVAPEEKNSFHEKIFASENEQIKSALERLRKFKNEVFFLGAKEALEKLFLEREYFVYLKSQIGDNAVSETESLLAAIAGFENDKDLPELISYLKSSITFSNVSGQNAVTISSVHASKGLEYPIVFLIGTGKPMLRSEASVYKIDKDFGLGLMAYDDEKWERFASPILVAARESFKARERMSELMVLYVALTRAKCHLFVTGTIDSEKVQNFKEENFEKYSSYLSLILSTQPELGGFEVQECSEVEKLENATKKIHCPKFDIAELKQQIFDYLNFEYPYEADTSRKQKASVTELAHSGEGVVFADPAFAEEGTAYHEAMEIIDFENVENVEQIKNQLISKKYPENYLKIVNLNTILENINLIKPFIKNKKIIKEKEFTMRLNSENGTQLVQGTVDLYLKGDKNILIDYKYTRENNPEILLNRYSKQLLLYKEAIEKAENIKIDEVYLMSLKNKKIIKY